jgi:hypothetical protein
MDIIERLNHCIVTASNDDLSEPMTEKRQRHIERIEIMADAILEIEALRLNQAGAPVHFPLNQAG